jgi:hypothetical protein
MSVPQVPPSDPAPKQGLGGCATTLLVLVGIVLLLPGICSVIAAGLFGGSGGLALIYLATFAIAAGGIVLIRYAVRNR